MKHADPDQDRLYTYAQIAEKLDCSKRCVQMSEYRGLRKLKQYIENNQYLRDYLK